MKLPSLLALVLCVAFVAPVFAQKPELVVQTGHSSSDQLKYAFSPDGKYLATAGKFSNPSVKIWHIETGKEIASLQPVSRGYGAIYWNPNDNNLHILSGFGSKSYVYDGKTFQLKSVSSTLFQKPTRAMGYTSSYNHDGSSYVVSGYDSPQTGKDSITVLESTSNTVKAILPSSDLYVQFSPNGKLLFTIGDKLRVWSGTTFQEIWSRSIDSIDESISWSFSPDSRLLCCGLGDSLIQCFESNTGKEVFSPLQTQKHGTIDIAFMPDSKHLLSLGSDGTIKMWNVEEGRFVKTVCNYGATSGTLTVSPNGKTVVFTQAEQGMEMFGRKIFLADIESGKILRQLSGSTTPVGKFATKHDGSSLLVISQADRATLGSMYEYQNIWNVALLSKPHKKLTRKLPSYAKTNCINSQQNNLIACEYTSTKVVVWNTETDSVMQQVSSTNGESIKFAGVKLIDKSNSVFFTNTIEYGIQMRPQIAEAIKRFQR